MKPNKKFTGNNLREHNVTVGISIKNDPLCTTTRKGVYGLNFLQHAGYLCIQTPLALGCKQFVHGSYLGRPVLVHDRIVYNNNIGRQGLSSPDRIARREQEHLHTPWLT